MTASHAKANDMIVHFGHCCLSTETCIGPDNVKKNILYVLQRPAGVDIAESRERIKELMESENAQVMVYCDLQLI